MAAAPADVMDRHKPLPPGHVVYDQVSKLAILFCADRSCLALRTVRPESVQNVRGISAALWWSTHIDNHDLGPVVAFDGASQEGLSQ